MVFYLKYRPQKVAELDSSEVREKLTAVLSSKRSIPHALLFTGPKGLGKTSTARILAKAINCTNRKSGEVEPCNKCIQCKSVSNGSNLDVLEIDAASNRGIDEIRDLREKIRLSPILSSKKVYIIDEVHMLTTEAFNALLKTLEEPPNHAVFVLCTTEFHKVPKTIISRCFQINFNRASSDELLRSLKRIAKGEVLKIDDNAIFSIAKLSDGSFRDGSKILEEISRSAGSKKITQELVEESYKIKSLDKKIEEFVVSLSQKNLKEAVLLLNSLEESGVDARFFTEELISYLHELLVENLDEKPGGPFKIWEIKKLFEEISESYGRIKFSIFPFLPLEILAIDWCQKEDVIDTPTDEETHQASSAPKHDNMLVELIEGVKKTNFSVAGVLRACSLSLSDGVAILETPYKFHKEKLSEVKTKQIIENTLREMFGKKINLEIKLRN